MEKLSSLKEISKVHLIGVGGISMSGIALYLSKRGYKVSGSDIKVNSLTKELIKQGVTFFLGHSRENVTDQEVVVYTSAIKEDNEEIQRAREKNLYVLKRSEFLNLIIKTHAYSIGVSGSHGKTTATSMLAHIFISANKHPTVFLGGEDVEFGNCLVGRGKLAIFEACEYRKNFLDIECNFALVLNVDNDHGDSYSNIDEQISTFNTFISDKTALVNGDDVNSKTLRTERTYTFGLNRDNDFSARNLEITEKGYAFDVFFKENELSRINLNIKGKHNVYNALSSYATGYLQGIDSSIIKIALENFSSVQRRNETIGEYKGVKLICDYAHHPKEIKRMIEQYDEEFKDYLLVFQPHTYSRTESLMDEFIEVLKVEKPLIIYKTYPAREKYNKKGSAKTLFSKLAREKSNCFYVENKRDLEQKINQNIAGISAIIILGAGDIYELSKKIAKNVESYIKGLQKFPK